MKARSCVRIGYDGNVVVVHIHAAMRGSMAMISPEFLSMTRAEARNIARQILDLTDAPEPANVTT